MNKFSLSVALLLSFGAFANDPLRSCFEFDFDSQKNECIKIINSGHFEEVAAMFCVSLDYSTQKLSCLDLVKNKTFSPSAIRLCEDYSYSSQKLECLKLTGVDYLPENGNEREALEKISLLAKEIKLYLYEGQLGQAVEKLNKIIDITSDYLLD